ncbi:MAG: hypothetical protein ABSH22_21590 [Tepidisphaeraceae bacterium]|jgi:hypothetical protein
MSDKDAQFQRLMELAHLPPADSRRKALEREIELMDSQGQQFWRELLGENDRIFTQMGDIPMPPDLEERLLRLPDSPLAIDPWWKQALARPVIWKAAAACAILAAGVVAAIYLYNWGTSAGTLGGPQALPDSLAMTISQEAIAYHESSSAPEVAGPDAARIEAALKGHDLTFPVMMLEPRDPLVLQGGGVCTIDGIPAAYTRWQASDLHYTLYQFDGARIGVPASFHDTTESPLALWHDNFHPRVVIWPGPEGKCTWALVMDSDSARNEFRNSY